MHERSIGARIAPIGFPFSLLYFDCGVTLHWLVPDKLRLVHDNPSLLPDNFRIVPDNLKFLSVKIALVPNNYIRDEPKNSTPQMDAFRQGEMRPSIM